MSQAFLNGGQIGLRLWKKTSLEVTELQKKKKQEVRVKRHRVKIRFESCKDIFSVANLTNCPTQTSYHSQYSQ